MNLAYCTDLYLICSFAQHPAPRLCLCTPARWPHLVLKGYERINLHIFQYWMMIIANLVVCLPCSPVAGMQPSESSPRSNSAYPGKTTSVWEHSLIPLSTKGNNSKLLKSRVTNDRNKWKRTAVKGIVSFVLTINWARTQIGRYPGHWIDPGNQKNLNVEPINIYKYTRALQWHMQHKDKADQSDCFVGMTEKRQKPPTSPTACPPALHLHFHFCSIWTYGT